MENAHPSHAFSSNITQPQIHRLSLQSGPKVAADQCLPPILLSVSPVLSFPVGGPVGGLIKCFLPRGESDFGPFYARCDDENERSQRSILARLGQMNPPDGAERRHCSFGTRAKVVERPNIIRQVSSGPCILGWDMFCSMRKIRKSRKSYFQT